MQREKCYRGKLLCGILLVAAFCCGGCAKERVSTKMELAPERATALEQHTAATVTPNNSAQPGPSEANTGIDAGREIAVDSPAGITTPLPATANSLESVYFNFASAELSDAARDTLVKNAARVGMVPIQIEGNCDERGSDDYNLALGERRARTVRDYLIGLGVKPELLTTISYGEERPAVTGHDDASWAQNRRVEFHLVDHK